MSPTRDENSSRSGIVATLQLPGECGEDFGRRLRHEGQSSSMFVWFRPKDKALATGARGTASGWADPSARRLASPKWGRRPSTLLRHL
jgi:hypothetical protein